jgi:hypothetical protein
MVAAGAAVHNPDIFAGNILQLRRSEQAFTVEAVDGSNIDSMTRPFDRSPRGRPDRGDPRKSWRVVSETVIDCIPAYKNDNIGNG